MLVCDCAALPSQGLVLDYNGQPPDEDADPNDIEVFLALEVLLGTALLLNARSGKRSLQSEIARQTKNIDLFSLSVTERERVINKIASTFQSFSEEISPAQQQALKKGMTDIGQRTRKAVQKPGPGVAAPIPDLPGVRPDPKITGVPFSAAARIPELSGEIWAARDIRAVEFLSQAQGVYAGKYLTETLPNAARNILTRGYLEYGDDAEKITQLMRKSLIALPNVTEQYWRTVAVNALANARSYSNLRALDEMGLLHFQFVSVEDNRRTPLCKSLHGRIFPVRPALDRMERAISAADLDSLEKFSPMVRQIPGDGVTFSVNGLEFSESASTEWLIQNGVMIPPLHFFCRSTIVRV